MGTVVQGRLRCQVWGSLEGRVSEICQAGLGISLGDSVLGLALGLVPRIGCVEGWAGKQKSGELEISQMNRRQKDVLARQVSTR